tara:strand:+ start:1653 stop:7160 length:5508 start_codon:yes stop_codon:yes gene_type:complete
MSIDGIGARTGATYTDMRLVDARTIPDGESYLVQFTYETIGSTFVQVKDDTISFTESGLRRVQRESIAAAGTEFSQTVGTTAISHQINEETEVSCRLAAYEIDDTDSSRTVIATYVEEGTLSRTEDFVGSQKAIVIEAIGPDPDTPEDYSLASKEESNFDGLQTNRFTFLKDGAVLSSTTEERQSGPNSTGKVRIQTVEVFNGTPVSTIGGVKISEQQSNVGAIVTTRAVFASGSGEVSRSAEKRNNGKLTITTIESLGSAGSASGVEIEATTREEDGFTLFRNVFADGSGEISRTTETRNNGKLTIVTVEALGSSAAASGVIIESTERQENGFTLFRDVSATGEGEISRTTETRNEGLLIITTVESLGSPGSATGKEIESTERQENGFTLFRNVFAQGEGEISRTTEQRNKGKLTITTVESLGSAGSAEGLQLEATTQKQDGYTLFRNVFALGEGEISRSTEDRNNGKLTITTVESLGTAGTADGTQIEATTREENGFTLFRNVFALGEGEISRTVEKRNQGELTITTVESLGSAVTESGVEIESTQREEDGFILFRKVFAEGSGEILRTTETRNQGKLTITTVESIGDLVQAPGVEIELTERKENGFTVFRSTGASGEGQISSTTETRNKGALIITTIESIGSAGSAEGVEIEATSREENGFTLFRNTFAAGSGEVSRTTEIRNNGALTIITVESLGSAGSGEGVEIEATTREENGFTLFRNVFAAGEGEVSRTIETRNKGALTITTVESLGSAGSASGVEIEATTREENGFRLFRNVFADGEGEISRTLEERNKGALIIATVESLGTKVDAPGDVELESTERQENGFTLFRSVRATGQGEISRTREERNKGALVITTVESLATKIEADGDVELESTERQENGFTLFRSVKATGEGEISRTVEKRNKDKLTITTIESLGTKIDEGADSDTSIEIESTERQENGFTIFRSVRATGSGEISKTVEERNKGALIITTVESLGIKEDADGEVEIESTERQENGFTIFRSVKATGTGEISRTEDFVGSQKAVVIEHLGDTDVVPPGGDYVKAREEVSDVNNVIRKRVTFLLRDAELSRSEDKVGSQLAIVTEVFNPTSDPAESQHELAKTEKSNVQGIPTTRFTFLKPNAVLSRNEDKLGSLETIVTEIFKSDGDITEGGFTEVSRDVSDVDGIKTERYTFYKDDAIISKTADLVNGQQAVVIEKFKSKPTKSDAVEFGTGNDYEIARKEQEGKEGAEIYRYTFLQKNTELSKSEDKLGSLETIVKEIFDPEGEITEGGFTEVSREDSNVDGIKTQRLTFYKDNAIISQSAELVESQQAVVIERFQTEPNTGDAAAFGSGDNYEIARKEQEGKEGAEIYKYTFLQKDAVLSRSEDKLGALEVVVLEVFSPEDDVTESGFTAISQEDSNVGGIKTERITFYKDDAIISKSIEKVGSQKAVVIEKFKTAPNVGDAAEFGLGDNYEIAREEVQGKEGVEIYKYTFLQKNSVLSRRVERKQGGALPKGEDRLSIEVVDVFQPDDVEGISYSTIGAARFISEEISEVDGIRTIRFTYVVANTTETLVSTNTTSADPSLPITCQEITEVHVATPEPALVGDERLVRESVQKQDGYELHTRTYLKGDIAGVTTEYEDYIEVEVPGEVTLETETVSSGGDSGEIAIVKVQPKRIERKKANVKVEIIKVESGGEIPPIGEIAFDLGKISCSVTATNIQRSLGPGSTVTIGAGTNNINSDTGFVADFKVQTSVTNYPGHFIKGDKTKEGSIEYISSSQPVASGNVISRAEETVSRVTKLVATGSDENDKTSSYKESGIISRKVRPVLVDLQEGSAAKYYEVITTSIGI